MCAFRASINSLLAVVAITLLSVVLSVVAVGQGATVALAQEVLPGTSTSGVVPTVRSDTGENRTDCGSIHSEVPLTTSGKLVWQADEQAEKIPDGFTVTVTDDKKFVSWTSEWPITAVIVRGNNSSHIYLYVPPLLEDAGLIAPLGNNDRLTNVGVVTFCWLEPIPDLEALCEAAGTDLGLGEVVSFAGPISFQDGVAETLAIGVTASYASESVTFGAPFPVVMVVTLVGATIEYYAFDPAVTTGSVDLAAPGSGEVVLCGLTSTTTSTTTPTTTTPTTTLPPESVATFATLPTAIASGGGPRTGALLALFGSIALAAFALTRSSTKVLSWRRN